MLKSVLKHDAIPMVEIRLYANDSPGYKVAMRNCIDWRDSSTDTPLEDLRMPAMIDNWCRLGLIEAGFHTHLAANGIYDWVNNRPEYSKWVAFANSTGGRIEIRKGAIRRTHFGVQFAGAIGLEIINSEIAV